VPSSNPFMRQVLTSLKLWQRGVGKSHNSIAGVIIIRDQGWRSPEANADLRALRPHEGAFPKAINGQDV